jgi:hypothetical protein
MTVKDLLHKLLDYRYIWVLPQHIRSKPAEIRREQIEALQEAFGLTKKNVNLSNQITYSVNGETLERATHLKSVTNMQYLVRGEFLHDRPKEQNEELTQRVKTVICELYPHIPVEQMDRFMHIPWIFNNLFNFREEIYKVSFRDAGPVEGFSAGLSYSHHLKRKLKEVIKNNVEEIDETLCLILDPTKRTLEKRELVERYNYPDVDLEMLDGEWLSGY